MSSNNREEQRHKEQQYQQAFGVHTGISEACRNHVRRVKDNDAYVLELDSEDTEPFTNQAWEMLGRYIASSTCLEKIDLSMCNVTNREMALLFSEFVGSDSIIDLDLDDNQIGIDGIRSMTAFLQNSPQLDSLWLGLNRNINTECFKLLMNILRGTNVAVLHVGNCNITNISSLETHTLPNLQELILNDNNIGREGCITISNLLQKEGSTLKEVFLGKTGIDDEGAEMIAASLKNNTTLERLSLKMNGITEIGCKVFLKLLVDISSINNTYNSNSTLTECNVFEHNNNEMQTLINGACMDNRSIDAGKAKVIRSHLNSRKLKKLCHLQGIEYSAGNIFSDIEPVLLPKILALIGVKHGQSELYTALIHTAPDLLSYIDRKAMLKDVQVKNTARAAALSHQCAQQVSEYEEKIAALKANLLAETSRLTAHNVEVSNRLETIELGDSKQLLDGEGERRKEIGSSKKRQRR